jgi:hypothetical protein
MAFARAKDRSGGIEPLRAVARHACSFSFGFWCRLEMWGRSRRMPDRA